MLLWELSIRNNARHADKKCIFFPFCDKNAVGTPFVYIILEQDYYYNVYSMIAQQYNLNHQKQ